ncbi:hypothetical protein [Petrotoga halophila]|uniref:hypothetical protein n=1 Tax=Petrotoga halophila TaxID=301141 RepID=UPI0014727944|nr:hypothetical protein [Petrotoga halophila]
MATAYNSLFEIPLTYSNALDTLQTHRTLYAIRKFAFHEKNKVKHDDVGAFV